MLSIPDMALLGAAALLLFGPEQLPRVARRAGNVMREIQNTSQSFIREMERAADLQDEASAKPHEPPAYDPVPYDATAYPDMGAYEPPAPEPDAPGAEASPSDGVGEKLAEPRDALDRAENEGLPAAEPSPQADHPAHL